ncbi:hypothetical protein [[Kitasatospora] papulosa]|uniref:hypothetical protein n=1 Tax=[Kitasatospora] papulosa TaxID=1464011 RepID=UPI0036316DBF
MNHNPIPHPQLGAATALVQLLSENPHLPMLDWSVPDGDGPLVGQVINDGVDMEPLIAAYEQVLGGRVSDFTYRRSDGEQRYSASLYATWRDIQILVRGTCSAASHLSAVAA